MLLVSACLSFPRGFPRAKLLLVNCSEHLSCWEWERIQRSRKIKLDSSVEILKSKLSGAVETINCRKQNKNLKRKCKANFLKILIEIRKLGWLEV